MEPPDERIEPATSSRTATSSRPTSSGSSSDAKLDDVKRVAYLRMEPKTGLKLSQVDGNLCTHVILASARISAEAKLVVWRQSDLEYLEEVRPFKLRYPTVRVMISVSNDTEFNGFPMLAHANNELRYTFAKSVVEFLEHYQLDGVDLRWEYPNFPAGLFNLRGELERCGLTKMVKFLRSAMVENFFNRQQRQRQLDLEQQTGGRHNQVVVVVGHISLGEPSQQVAPVEPHLLTVSVAGQEAILRQSYELKQLASLSDWLNVMSYDYFLFKPYLPFTGPSAPLHPLAEHYPILNKLALSWTIQHLLEAHVDPEKLVLGVQCHARAYRLVFHQSGTPQPFTLALGTRGGLLESDQLTYREVRQHLAQPGTVVEFDERARVPYLLTDAGYTWISYENERSVREKVRYLLERQLGGYMTWSLNSDDFEGGHPADSQPNGHVPAGDSLGGAKFPLHRAMLEEVVSYKQQQPASSG